MKDKQVHSLVPKKEACNRVFSSSRNNFRLEKLKPTKVHPRNVTINWSL